MDFLREVFIFLWAVINNWAGYSTGGIIVATVALWHTLRNVPPSRKLLIVLATFFFCLALFKAWQDQYRRANNSEAELNKQQQKFDKIYDPNLTLDFGQISVGWYPDFIPPGRGILFELTVTNIGAPSVAHSFALEIQGASGKIWRASRPSTLTDRLRVDLGDYEMVLSGKDALYNKVATPIPTGGEESGYLLFMIPDLPKGEIQPGAKGRIGFKDVRKKQYIADFQIPTQLDQSLGYYPGTVKPEIIPKNKK